MSQYREYEFKAVRTEEGDIRLSQSAGVEDCEDVIFLTPEQLVRLGEWAKAWVSSRGER